MSNIKNIAPLIIIILVIALVWVLISPENELVDPFEFLSVYSASLVTILLISVLLLLVIYHYRKQFFLFLLVILKLVHLLNICTYCTTIRSDIRPYLVEGYCKSCNIYLCSKCFNFQDVSKKTGCPNCGSCVFIANKRLAYPFLLQNWLLKRVAIIFLVIALVWVLFSPVNVLVDPFEFLSVYGASLVTILLISVLPLLLIYHYRKQRAAKH